MPTESPKKESKGGLLKSITSLFSGGGSTEDNGKETAEEVGGNSFVDRITGRVGRHKDGNKPTKILPGGNGGWLFNPTAPRFQERR